MATISTAVEFEEGDLIKRAVAGDGECFAILVDRHISSVRKCVGCLVRNPSDTDDVVQEVLLKVWTRLSSFRAESTFRTWIRRVAINEALMQYRRKRSRLLPQPLEDLDRLASRSEEH